MKVFGDAKLKLGAFLRERKERAEAKKYAQGVRHFHARDWLIRATAFGVITAMFVEWGWALLFTINTTGHIVFNTDWASAFDGTHRWEWVTAFEARWPVLIGRGVTMIVIVIWSTIWLPMWFLARGGGRWARITMAAIGIWCNALVAMQGTFVLNETRQDQVRRDLNIEQTAAQGRAGLVARRDQVQGRLNALIAPTNTSNEGRAARAGVEGWRVYIETSRRQLAEGQTTADRFARIESALGSAVAAQEYQRQIDDLTAQIASAPTEAAVAAHVEDRAGAGMDAAGQTVEVYWPLAAALGMTAFGILGAWWLTVVWGLGNSIERSGWADEGHRIEDMRDEPAIQPERDASGKVKMKPPRRKFTEADTGEEIEQTLVPEHYRTIKRNKPVQMPITPEVPPDETGVPRERDGRDAGLYAASMHQPVEELSEPVRDVADVATEQSEANDARASAVEPAAAVLEETNANHAEPSEETVADLNALVLDDSVSEDDGAAENDGGNEAEAAAIESPVVSTDDAIDHIAPEQEGAEADGRESDQDEIPQREEPETDPARMIAAE